MLTKQDSGFALNLPAGDEKQDRKLFLSDEEAMALRNELNAALPIGPESDKGFLQRVMAAHTVQAGPPGIAGRGNVPVAG